MCIFIYPLASVPHNHLPLLPQELTRGPCNATELLLHTSSGLVCGCGKFAASDRVSSYLEPTVRWPLDGRCYRLYGRGICPPGHWFVWSSADNRMPVCCPSQYSVRAQSIVNDVARACLTRPQRQTRCMSRLFSVFGSVGGTVVRSVMSYVMGFIVQNYFAIRTSKPTHDYTALTVIFMDIAAQKR